MTSIVNMALKEIQYNELTIPQEDLLSFPPDENNHLIKDLILISSPTNHSNEIFDIGQSQLSGASLENLLKSFSTDELQLLHQILKPIFTDNVNNEWRSNIVESFKNVPSDLWIKIGKQIQFLLPPNSDIRDICSVAQTLAEITNIKYRDSLVNIAHQFYDWDSESFERAKILKELCELDLDSLEALNNLSLEKKDQVNLAIREKIKIHLHPKSTEPSEILKRQVQFLLFHDAQEQDRVSIIEILSKIEKNNHRDLLIRIASQLFDLETSSKDRIQILKGLSQCSFDNISSINSCSLEGKKNLRAYLLNNINSSLYKDGIFFILVKESNKAK